MAEYTWPGGWRCKITPDNITYGPTDLELDDEVADKHALYLKWGGYKCVSRAYCMLARIDREDWLEKMAEERRISPAMFYNRDGSGINQRHYAEYCRTYSKDVITVHPFICREMESWT